MKQAIRSGALAGALAVMAAAPPAAAQGARPPVVRLSFDEHLDDEGPYAFRSRAFGDGVRRVPGFRGQALWIDGTEDWLDLSTDDRLSLAKGFTLELWLRRDDWTNPYKGGSGWQTVAAVAGGASLAITAPGCPLHEPWALEGSVDRFRKDVKERELVRTHSPGHSVTATAWTHAALVYDAEAATLALYMDGRRVDLARGAPPPDFDWNFIRLGTWHKANQAYRGEIDELRLFDYPLTEEAVARAAAGGARP